MPLYNPPVNLQNEGIAQGSTDTLNIVGPGIAGEVSSSTGTITVSTATAVNTGAVNAEGNADTLARSNHTHAVTDLSIAGQAAGDILYFNGTNWVRLAAGTSGAVLQTQGAAAPRWITPAGEESNGTTVDPTSTSASFQVIPEMTITFTSIQLDAHAIFSCTFRMISGDNFDIAIFVDGVEYPGTRRHMQFTGASGVLGLSPGSIDGTSGITHALISGLSAASHTIDVRWSRSAGTARCVGTQRKLIVKEVT